MQVAPHCHYSMQISLELLCLPNFFAFISLFQLHFFQVELTRIHHLQPANPFDFVVPKSTKDALHISWLGKGRLCFLKEKLGSILLALHFCLFTSTAKSTLKKETVKTALCTIFCSKMGMLLARKWMLYAPLVPGVYVAPGKAQFFLAPVTHQLCGCFMGCHMDPLF